MSTKDEARAFLRAIRQTNATAKKSLDSIQRKEVTAQNTLGVIQEHKTATRNARDVTQEHKTATRNARDVAQEHKTATRNALDATRRKAADTQGVLEAARQKDADALGVLEAVQQKNADAQGVLEAVQQKNAYIQNTLDELKEYIETLTTANKEALEKLKSTEQQVSDALGDATAAGLTRAFTRAIKVEEKRKRTHWLWWAGAGAGIALVVAGLLLWQQISSSSQLNFWGFISRATATAIPLAVAWFCGSQYIKLENTLEDYRYKKVLAQSMANFMKQLADVDEERRIYLLKLFQQMLQDPLRRKHDIKAPFIDAISDLFAPTRKGRQDDDSPS